MLRVFRRFKKDECSRTREMLSGYIDRRLEPEDVAQVERHLGSCAGCRTESESLRATLKLLHQLPEVTPSRSFAVAPVRPLPGRRALPALRFATAAVALLLVLAFVADRTDLFGGGTISNRQFGPSTLDVGPAKTSGEGKSYWVVSGEKRVENNIEVQSATPVELVVPNGSDNVSVVVHSLVVDDVIYAKLVTDTDEVPQLVVAEGDNGGAISDNTQEFAVVSAASEDHNGFAPNGDAISYKLYSVMEGQVGTYLNMLSSDNVLYSFDLAAATTETVTTRENAWLRPLEYGLIGLVAVLSGATAALWFSQRRQKVAETSRSWN